MSTQTAVIEARTGHTDDGCPSCGAGFHNAQNYCTQCRYMLRTKCFRCGRRLAVSGHARCKARRG